MSFIAVGIGAAVVGTALGVNSANKAKKAAEKKEAAATAEMNRQKEIFSQ